MGAQARRHHVVSKFYLRYFADENERVTTVELPGEQRFTQGIADASVRKDFYTVVDADGQTSDVIEREAFGAVESEAAAAWRALDAGIWPLPDEHRANMAGWLGLQLLRGNAVRDSMNQIGTHGLTLDVIVGGRERVRLALQAAGEPADEASVDREWIDFFRNPLHAAVHANHHLHHIGRLLPEVVAGLLNRLWILTVFERKPLATSDHPVCVVPNKAMTEMGLGTGILNADEIFAPLTRRLALTMVNRAPLPPKLANLAHDIQSPGVAKTALYSNSCTSRNARRFLYHHPAEDPLEGLDLPEPRKREMSVNADPWRWMREDDQKVLLGAGIGPEAVRALLH